LPTAVLEPAQALRPSGHEQVGKRPPQESAGPYVSTVIEKSG
jgi:hypothetical protein